VASELDLVAAPPPIPLPYQYGLVLFWRTMAMAGLTKQISIDLGIETILSSLNPDKKK
jgi:hypothetical protein